MVTALLIIFSALLGFLIARSFYLEKKKIDEFRILKGFISFYCIQLQFRYTHLEKMVLNEDDDFQRLEYFANADEVQRIHEDMRNYWEKGFKDAYKQALLKRTFDWFIG